MAPRRAARAGSPCAGSAASTCAAATLLEDIVDSGLTARKLMNRLRRRGPVNLALCTLLRKRIANGVPVTIAYQGFEIPDRFVVGYGMDYAERYRNLRGVYILSFGCDARPAGH